MCSLNAQFLFQPSSSALITSADMARPKQSMAKQDYPKSKELIFDSITLRSGPTTNKHRHLLDLPNKIISMIFSYLLSQKKPLITGLDDNVNGLEIARWYEMEKVYPTIQELGIAKRANIERLPSLYNIMLDHLLFSIPIQTI